MVIGSIGAFATGFCAFPVSVSAFVLHVLPVVTVAGISVLLAQNIAMSTQSFGFINACDALPCRLLSRQSFEFSSEGVVNLLSGTVGQLGDVRLATANEFGNTAVRPTQCDKARND